MHRGEIGDRIDLKTVVILQDKCYGHRYSRPRTSRAGLSSIVERPERIHASVLGLATAYVRLGGRHVEGHSPLHPKRNAKAPPPFKVHKTKRTLSLTSQATINVHGLKWMNELKTMCEAAETKLALNGKELTRPTSSEQASGSFKSEQPKLHEGDLYLCSESLEALEGALGGVCEGIDAVFDESNAKRAFVCIRPPGHHCSADYPSGFCWLNNVHVGISHAALTHGLTHAAIIDFDLHHGDGSQSITWAHNTKIASLPKNTPMSKKTAIGYFSLHDINSYPCEMGDEEKVRNASLCLENAHGQTIWNVHLQPWKTEADFWRLYEERYILLLSKARTFLRLHTGRLRQSPMHPQPKAAVFLSAGFDASEWESPGMQRHQVNVPTDFYARFTRDVVRLAEEDGLGVDGRVISVLEGGYSDRALMSGVLSHMSGLTFNDRIAKARTLSNGLAHDMARRLGSLNINGQSDRNIDDSDEQPTETFDTNWWALDRLEEIENLINPPAPAAAPKKQRNAVPPTYSSTTQSFSAKVVTSSPGRRSLSGSASYFHNAQSAVPRVPEQPPPPVSWATAAHELSKLLIPSDRETKSCKPEELNAEASRARKARHSTIGLPAEAPIAAPTADIITDSKRMQLRNRTAKAPKYASEEEDEKPVSRANRRRTIADPALLADGTESIPANKPLPASPRKPSAAPRSRRVSAASSIASANGDRAFETSSDISALSQPRKDPLVIKKTRVPSVTRSEAPRPNPVRKPPPVPRVPSAYSAVPRRTPSVPGVEEALPAPQELSKDQNLDSLASGMKKMSIKLNMPPREVQEAKEAKHKPVARGRPKSVAPKIAKPAQADKTPDVDMKATREGTTYTASRSEPSQRCSSVEERIFPATDPVKPTKEHESTITDFLSPMVQSEGQLADASPRSRPIPTYSHVDPAPDSMKSNDQDQPMSFAAPIAPTIPAPAPIAPPIPVEATLAHDPLPEQPPTPKIDHGSPVMPSITDQPPIATAQSPPPSTPKRTRHDLPVFSATSPIFFGGPKGAASGNGTALGVDLLNRTEQRATPSAQLSGANPASHESTAPRKSDMPTDHSHNGATAADSKLQKASQASIWDIPETPESRRK